MVRRLITLHLRSAFFLLKTCHRQFFFTQKALSGFESLMIQTQNKKSHLSMELCILVRPEGRILLRNLHLLGIKPRNTR